MAVSNYTPNKCKYRIDELDNVVYIVNKEGIGGIKVDDGEAYIDGVGYYNAINCLSVSLSESESLDERYEFLHTVNFSVTGYLHWYELNDYYVMLKDKSNTYWLVNPYFKIKYTYTYTLDATSNHTDYVVSTKSNYPLLRVKNFNADNVKPCKTYDYCGVDVMAINETTYSKYVESFDAEIEQYVGRVKYTNDGFKIVNYKKNTCVFTETFDGNNISHSVKFQVNFDDYKASWHYNLLEFTDNKYAVILSTKCGKKVATGFGYGLQPSYTVTADDNQAINNIEIQLSDLHDNGNLLKMPDELPFEHDSATTWNNVEGEYTCIDSTTGVYTLRQEYDIFGNALNNYMCLQGFEDRYASYHIVGTFTDEESFYCPQCRAEECTLQTSFPSNLSFYTTGCKTFSIRSSSDFTIESDTPYITVSPSAGTANQSYSVTVCNSQTPTSTAYIYLLTVTYCSGQTKDYSVTVTEAPVIDCLPNGDEYNVSVYAQDVTIPTNCCIQSVSASCCVSNIQIQDGYVKFRIDANNSGAERTITLTFTKCDNTTVDATITQAHYYSKWVYEGSQCNGEEWCALDRMYSGETSDNINTPTYITRYRDCRASSACATPIYKWENMDATTDFYCNDCPIQYKWENMNPSTDFYCNNCEIVPQYRWINLDPTVDYYCSGTTKYYKQQQQISTDGGNVWENVSPPQYRRGESAQTQSSDCGYIPTIEYRWIDLDPSVDYYCSGTTKYYKEKKQYSLDSGVTWIDVTPAEYQWGASAETESEDCGYVPSEPIYEWRRITPVSGDSSTFICQNCYPYGNTKLIVTYNNSYTYFTLYCDDNTTLTSDTIKQRIGGYQYTAMTEAAIGSCITSIGNNAFQKCSGLTSVTIPNSVTSIGDGAFISCTGLTSIYIPSGVTSISNSTFHYCNSLTSVTIPDSVTSIGINAFVDCRSLTSVTIPSGVTYIGNSAFWACDSLTSVTCLATTPPTLGNNYVFTNNCPIYVPAESVDAYKSAWWREADRIQPYETPQYRTLTTATTCVGVDKYTLEEYQVSYDGGSTWQTTGTSATTLIEADSEDCGYVPPTGTKFLATYTNGTSYSVTCDSDTTLTTATTKPSGYDYATMTTARIGDCLTNIGDSTFTNCYSLTSIVIPESVTNIGSSTFNGCSGLTSVTIPNSVTSIGNSAFNGCSSLPSIEIPDSVTSIGQGAFSSCTSLTSVTIGSDVTSIGRDAFRGCTALTSVGPVGSGASVEMPSGVTYIMISLFNSCSSLTSVTIPDSVTIIDNCAFQDCSRMISVSIGSGVTYIGAEAFDGCRSLTSITCKATNPPTLGHDVLRYTNNCPIYVPAESVNTYKTATRWKDHASRIQAIP